MTCHYGCADAVVLMDTPTGDFVHPDVREMWLCMQHLIRGMQATDDMTMTRLADGLSDGAAHTVRAHLGYAP